ncbi:UDP-N-acetylglucosamine 1-carboxyvinyltransferase [Actinobacteria bacterium YIM 96077]|uniref:UDP-N-acetylglucosamine 1-carboxyvinyltransferase n=1 Tax=Phytoactinopolyspora halophila TaxID=1981511 RepID=A0A329QRH8_9ACTN|nr:UDP-N-acetylglucosamine 1-carboxyvinyltransferase [Phytoactinopolyspora halophila]AYY14271.1 UDP-N-acetylglucosamine 1-carboxyvinyltransferase [Actinobacteria bacterium YIM 96077]RAW14813.1 UDP-N-acetylglucosamine 1-carboxyvinyltransferase [Phytoactinopolyspora halophila]
MERLRVTGGASLRGSVRVSGAKNSALKLMASTLLAEGNSTLRDVPAITDVHYMAELLRRLGADVTRADNTVTIGVPDKVAHEAPYELVRRLRASICVLGPLLARCGAADVALPGGDAIGSRGLDMHIAGLQRLGAEVDVEHGYVVARAPRGLHGTLIGLDFPSVGATENILMAAVLARGETVIDNVAREPEIVDLCEMLIEMGARIDGVGSSTLRVEGVDRLEPADHVTVPDRIVAGTWAVAALMTRGDITVTNARADHLELVLDKLTRAGAEIEAGANGGLRVAMSDRPRAIDVVTLPYPGFPTDLQPMVVALNAVADGTAMITENVYEARFMFVNELVRLGAEVRIDGHHAVVRGRESLSGAPVVATDIRAGAGLVLAGLVSAGETLVSAVQHIDRGYPNFVGQLGELGAEVVREPDPDRFDD